MAWDRPKTVGASMLLVLVALVVLVGRLDGSAGDAEKGTEVRLRVIACTDKAGNYITCPPNLRLRDGR